MVLFGVFRVFLDGLPEFGAEAVGAPDAVDIEREGAGMGDVDVVQRDPEQAGRELAHQLLRDVDGEFVGAGEAAGVGGEIVHGELENFGHLAEFDLAGRRADGA